MQFDTLNICIAQRCVKLSSKLGAHGWTVVGLAFLRRFKKRLQGTKSSWCFSTHLKNISQIGSFPQVGMKIRKIETNT